MILNNKGDVYKYAGIRYVVGEKVIAIKESEYEGVVGRITEIRDGNDMETDNDGPDIYCCFEEPIISANKEKLKKRFSELWKKPMQIEDINLEQVIMVPDMIIPFETLQNKREFYLLLEHESIEGNESLSVDLFADYNDAKEYIEVKLSDEVDKKRFVFPGTPDECKFDEVTESGDSYVIGWKESYNDWSYSLNVQRCNIGVSDNVVKEIAQMFLHKMFADDFEAQVEDWEKLADFSDEEYEAFISNPEIPKRIAEELKNDESFMSEYIGAVSEIAHKIVDEAVKKRMEEKE